MKKANYYFILITTILVLGCSCTNFKMKSGGLNIETPDGYVVGGEVKDIEATGDIKTNESRSEVKNDGKTAGTNISDL